jgi:cytoskeletal protein CcmA (bactofilin family)
MKFSVRICSILFLAATLAAQEPPVAPEPPTVDQPLHVEVDSQTPKAPELDQAPRPDELQEPDWDPVAESTRIERNESPERRTRTRQRPVWENTGRERVAFGQHVVIGTNETLRSLVLVGGSAEILGEVERDVVAVGASVNVKGNIGGDLVVVGGKGTFSGVVDGDAVVVVGQAELAETARLNRNFVLIGGPLQKADGAAISGDQQIIPIGDFLPHIEWFKTYLVRGPLLGRWLTFELGWPWAVAGTFLAIYFALMLVFPSTARAVYNALEQRPVTSIFTGLLTLILFAPLTFLLIVSVAGIVVVPFLKIALLLALMFGKVGVLCFLGRGFARTSGATKLTVPFVAFVIGAIILTLSYAIPFFGMFAWAMATVFGLGGAIVALFGTFRREEANVPPAPVLVSTLRPSHSAPPVTSTTGSAPAASAPIPETPVGGAAAAASISSFAQFAGNLSPQDTVLLPRAGFWTRFLAALLDLFLIGTAVFLLPLIGPLLFVPLAVTYFVCMWTWKGTTVGGLIFGHKVVRTDGRELDFAVALVRSLLSIFSCLVGFLGCMWAGWDREKQTWHDKIAGTVVVKMPPGFALI